jgi:hypothetical protein
MASVSVEPPIQLVCPKLNTFQKAFLGGLMATSFDKIALRFAGKFGGREEIQAYRST